MVPKLGQAELSLDIPQIKKQYQKSKNAFSGT